MAENKNKNITRIDIETAGVGTHGYEVRVMRRGKAFHKFFNDRKFGGKRKALAAAREYRDELVARLPVQSRKALAKVKSSRNTSGIVGVRLSEEVDRRGPNELVYHYWVAQWSPRPGVRRTRRFSVEKYGDEEAFRLAMKARRAGMREMED
ncbi:MAG: AP2 domain-containing protein [Planctomycetaceae bacterium]|nr:AP2 domain-containing protein [Planctomycetaceae bacterium]